MSPPFETCKPRAMSLSVKRDFGLGGLGAEPGGSNRPGSLWQLQDHSRWTIEAGQRRLYWKAVCDRCVPVGSSWIPVSDRCTLGGLTQFGLRAHPLARKL